MDPPREHDPTNALISPGTTTGVQSAARSVLSGEARTDPKRATIEPLRAMTVARRSALMAQQAAWRQTGALLVNSPTRLRDHYRYLPGSKRVAALVNTRPSQVNDPGDADTPFALRSLARRHRDLTDEVTLLEDRMQARATADTPDRLRPQPRSPPCAARHPSRSATAAPTATASPEAETATLTPPCTTS